MRANLARLCVSLLFGAGICLAQEGPVQSTQAVAATDHAWLSTVQCAGFFSTEKVPDDLRLVSGEQSEYKVTFTAGDIVYIGKGASQGVKDGDRFAVVRSEPDPLRIQWFKWQDKLSKAMGDYYRDLGQLTVIKTYPNNAVARVSFSCEPMQRGDVLRPYVDRPTGPFHDPAQFDFLAPVSGKPVAMVVQGKSMSQLTGRWDTVYVNLGTAKGVRVGDYFRVFRYQGTRAETIPIEKDYQDRLYGFGSNPKHYSWNDLPREVLGEGIVLNVSQNAATVLLTTVRQPVYSGDYVELE